MLKSTNQNEFDECNNVDRDDLSRKSLNTTPKFTRVFEMVRNFDGIYTISYTSNSQ